MERRALACRKRGAGARSFASVEERLRRCGGRGMALRQRGVRLTLGSHAYPGAVPAETRRDWVLARRGDEGRARSHPRLRLRSSRRSSTPAAHSLPTAVISAHQPRVPVPLRDVRPVAQHARRDGLRQARFPRRSAALAGSCRRSGRSSSITPAASSIRPPSRPRTTTRSPSSWRGRSRRSSKRTRRSSRRVRASGASGFAMRAHGTAGGGHWTRDGASGRARAPEQADDDRLVPRAAQFLAEHDIDLRVFVLLNPPFMAEDERSAGRADRSTLPRDCGATACSVIPTRAATARWRRSVSRDRAADVWPRSSESWSTACRAADARVRRPLGHRAVLRLCSARRAGGTPAADESRSSGRRRCCADVRRWGLARESDVDLAIVGSGFGGSLLAMIARRLGHRVCCSSAAGIRDLPSVNRRRRWPAS